MILKELKPQIQKFKEKVVQAKRILIVAHEKPDGDAIGSCLGMRVALQALGKEAEVAMVDRPPEAFSFLPYFFTIKDSFSPFDFDMAVILDCGNWERTGFFEDVELNIDWPDSLVVVDHHAVQTLSPGIHILSTQAASTTQLIYYICQEWGVDISRDLATCLLTGLSTDTGSFKHSNTDAEVFRVASKLMEAGASLNKIAGHIYMYNKPSKLKLWGTVLSKLQQDKELGIVLSVVTAEDLEKCESRVDELEGVIDLMNSVPGMKATMLFSQRDKGYKVSLRTESDDVDVSKLASIFGGGGHIKAAGFIVDSLQ